jgi:hypothetical protein
MSKYFTKKIIKENKKCEKKERIQKLFIFNMKFSKLNNYSTNTP